MPNSPFAAEFAPTNAPAVAPQANPFADEFAPPKEGKSAEAPGAMAVSKDMVKSGAIGVPEGLIDLATGPATMRETSLNLAERGANAIGAPPSTTAAIHHGISNAMMVVPPMLGGGPTAQQAQGEAEKVTGPFYQPQTPEGGYTNAVTKAVVGAVAGPANSVKQAAFNAVKYGVIPALASETVGNLDLVKGTALEPWARALTSVATGGMVYFATRPGTPEAIISKALPSYVTQENLQQAKGLMDSAMSGSNKVPLTWAEALSKVTGRPVLQDMQRILESAPQSRGAMQNAIGGRAQAIQGRAGAAMGSIGEASEAPSQLGLDVQQAAVKGMGDTPQGQALNQSQFDAGPRTTPEQAGSVIQSELAATRAHREGMRNAVGDEDFDAARNAPADVPMNGGFGFRDVDIHNAPPSPPKLTRNSRGQFMRPTEDQIAAFNLERPEPVWPMRQNADTGRLERMSPADVTAEENRRWQSILEQREQRMNDLNSRERLPVIGLKPTEFGQVDPRPVIDHIDTIASSEKGETAAALAKARGYLHTEDGGVETSVAGLENARSAINEQIEAAKRAGANHTVERLSTVRDALTSQMEQVPSHGQAVSNFGANSENVKPFENDALSKITERDQYNKDFATPPEQAPALIDKGGPSTLRNFVGVASPQAREAYVNHYVTQAMEKATTKGAISADAIRKNLAADEDRLNLIPEAHDRLSNIASAKDAYDRLSATPLGQLALKDPSTARAIKVLFPRSPLPNSQNEISEAVASVAQHNPWAAEQLVRTHVQQIFNEASRSLEANGTEFTGARFAIQLAGNPQQLANLRAAMQALPNGAVRWQGFSRFLDIMQATGERQQIGSRTSFNTLELQKLSQEGGGLLRHAQTAVSPQSAFTLFQDKLDQFRLGRNLNQLAAVLTDPKALPLFQKIVAAPSMSRGAQFAAYQLLTNMSAGTFSSKGTNGQ